MPEDAACEKWAGSTLVHVSLHSPIRVAGPCARRFFENLFDNSHNEETGQKAVDSTVQSGHTGTVPDVVPGKVTEVISEEDLNALVATGKDVVVKLAFTWCRPCKGFWPKFQKYARIYSNTIFVRIVGNANASCKQYAQQVLKAKISPMFAAYSGGRLVKTWTGANNQRFVENIEESLATARECELTREAEVLVDESIAPVAPVAPVT